MAVKTIVEPADDEVRESQPHFFSSYRAACDTTYAACTGPLVAKSIPTFDCQKARVFHKTLLWTISSLTFAHRSRKEDPLRACEASIGPSTIWRPERTRQSSVDIWFRTGPDLILLRYATTLDFIATTDYTSFVRPAHSARLRQCHVRCPSQDAFNVDPHGRLESNELMTPCFRQEYTKNAMRRLYIYRDGCIIGR